MVAVLAGCGSSAGASGGTGGAEPIKVGIVASASGAFAASIGGVPEVAKAWVDWTNAHGGVGGRQVELFQEDDGGVPAKGLQAVKRLIEDDQVVAIVGSASNTISGWYKLTDAGGNSRKQTVPVIGGQTNGGALFQTVPNLFPTGTTSTLGSFDVMKRQGATKLAVLYCAEAPVCASAADTTTKQLASHGADFPGISVVYSAAVSGSAPNYAAQCLAARQAGADAMTVATGGPTVLRVFDDCASQGFKPLVVQSGAAASNLWLGSPTFQGSEVTQQNFPWVADRTETQKTFNAAMQAYAPALLQEKEKFNSNAPQVWASFEVFKAAVEKNGSATVDAAAVTDGLYALGAKFTIPGITPPLTYTKGAPNPQVDCYFRVDIQGGKWVVPADGDDARCP